MTDLLAAFIEWLAVLAMSLVGIEYTPASDCETPAPAEYETVEYLPARQLRPASFRLRDDAALEAGWRKLSDCDTPALLLPAGETVFLVQNTRVYDS